jgi:hypothetical protein
VVPIPRVSIATIIIALVLLPILVSFIGLMVTHHASTMPDTQRLQSSLSSRSSSATSSSSENAVEEVGPYRLRAKVVTGFQRGSTQLGFPTGRWKRIRSLLSMFLYERRDVSEYEYGFFAKRTCRHSRGRVLRMGTGSSTQFSLVGKPCDTSCFVQVDDGPVYKAFVSVGTNPHYRNTKITVVCRVSRLNEDAKCFIVCVISFVGSVSTPRISQDVLRINFVANNLWIHSSSARV